MLQKTAEQEAIIQMAREITEKEIAPRALAMDKDGEVPAELWRILHQAGLTSLAVPQAYGGVDLAADTLAYVYEEIARGCAGIATACAANMLAFLPVKFGGTEEQIREFCDALLAGHMAAFALTEPNAGSDASAIATRADKADGGYLLNGTKHFITNGPLAKKVVVFANAKPGKGVRGLTAFLVDSETEGFSVGKVEDKMGIRASATSEIILQDCFVPESARVGREGGGFRLAMQTLHASRPFVGAIAVGIAQAALEATYRHVHTREQFGAKLIALQMVQQIVADMAMQTEAARLMVHRAAAMQTEGHRDAGVYASMAKCFASDAAMKITTDAVQVLGGVGYSREAPVEKYMRDAKVMQIFEGSNQVQRGIIANGLRLE
ncbi:MAG: acyl-CoA dehydrogenase family protein [Veillonellaceae bacterium]|nr:acyl-CoA dehydrogenase family protein [Veillonellaceae bacterium]